jgi:hypothetical protein
MSVYKNSDHYVLEAVFLTPRAAALMTYILARLYPSDKKWIKIERQYCYTVVKSIITTEYGIELINRKYEIYKRLDDKWYKEYLSSDAYQILKEIEEICQ